jgi:hypothetical protein
VGAREKWSLKGPGECGEGETFERLAIDGVDAGEGSHGRRQSFSQSSEKRWMMNSSGPT